MSNPSSSPTSPSHEQLIAASQRHSHPRPFDDHIYNPVQTGNSVHGDGETDDGNDDPAAEHTSATMDERVQRHLTRVQVITPLSILLNLASLVVCSVLVKPGLGDINARHITQFTPNPSFILLYWALLFLLQIGFAILIVVVQKDVTKRTIANGVGIRLALSNLLLGAWAITWVVDNHASFVASLVLLSLIGASLLITVLVLAVKYPPNTSRPLDWLLIHAPIKMFLVITLQLDIPQQVFIALGWYDKPDSSHHDERGHWPSFYILAATGAISAIWIFAASDVVWAVSGIYLHFSLLYSKAVVLSKRPPEIVAAIVLSIALQGVALIGSLLHKWFRSVQDAERQDEEGRVALGRNPQEEAAAARAEAEAEAAAAAARERSLAGEGSSARSTTASLRSADPSALERGEQEHSANGVKVSRRLGSSS